MCAQLCLTLCDPIDCSPPYFSVCGIFQARKLWWVAISYSRGSSWLRDRRTQVSFVSYIGTTYQWFFTTEPPRRLWIRWCSANLYHIMWCSILYFLHLHSHCVRVVLLGFFSRWGRLCGILEICAALPVSGQNSQMERAGVPCTFLCLHFAASSKGKPVWVLAPKSSNKSWVPKQEIVLI